jgi:hypothetical protein
MSRSREYQIEHWRELRFSAHAVIERFERVAGVTMPFSQRLERQVMGKQVFVDTLVAERAGICARVVRGPEETPLG